MPLWEGLTRTAIIDETDRSRKTLVEQNRSGAPDPVDISDADFCKKVCKYWEDAGAQVSLSFCFTEVAFTFWHKIEVPEEQTAE